MADFKKALASDLDGTLLLHDGRDDVGSGVVAARRGYFLSGDLEAVGRLQAAGCLFGICSGRPVAALMPELEQGGIHADFIVAMSGAVIVDGTGRALFERSLDFGFARKLYDELSPLVENHLLIQADDSYYTLGSLDFVGVRHLEDLSALEGRAVHGLAGDYGTEERAAEVCEHINERYGDQVFAAQNVNNVDISPAGCSKGSSVLRAKELLGIDLVAGIGDSYNDLTMLEVADVSYTFHRAPERVREAADVLVDTEAEAIGDLLAR